MTGNRKRKSEFQSSRAIVQHGASGLLAAIIFWFLMLNLLALPLWLPALVELAVK